MSQNLSANERAADADLLTRVGIALTMRLHHTPHAVHVHVDKSTVTLRGLLPSFYDRQLAIEVTRRVAGVLRVYDELSVAGQNDARQIGLVRNCRSSEATNAVPGAGTEPRARSSASPAAQRKKSNRIWRSWAASAATVLRGLFLASALLVMVGCGEALEVAQVVVHPAQGKITFQGQPIPGAMITLHPKQAALEDVPNPRANVGQDGAFAVSTFAGGDGAPEGEYVLTVVWYKPIKNGPDIQAGPNVIPPKYVSAKTSDLEIKIASGTNKIPTINL